jgi:urease accessory protein
MSDPAAYKLLAWLSPAMPVGAYRYSHGLEAALAAGRVTDAATLNAYV